MLEMGSCTKWVARNVCRPRALEERAGRAEVVAHLAEAKLSLPPTVVRRIEAWNLRMGRSGTTRAASCDAGPVDPRPEGALLALDLARALSGWTLTAYDPPEKCAVPSARRPPGGVVRAFVAAIR